MASEKVLEMKKAQVAELAGKMTDSVAGVLVEYKGINVADDTNLRRELREAGIDYSVIKNSIIGRAAEQAGLDGLKDVLTGTTAIAISKEDHVAAARILKNFSKTHDFFQIKSGYLNGEVVDLATVNSGQLSGRPAHLRSSSRHRLQRIQRTHRVLRTGHPGCCRQKVRGRRSRSGR